MCYGALDAAVGAQLLNGSNVTAPAHEVEQHPLLETGSQRITQLDLDDAVAIWEGKPGVEQILREVVPACADPDGNGEGEAASHGQAGKLPEHPDSQLHIGRRDHRSSNRGIDARDETSVRLLWTCHSCS
jgi:hypothetical protein